MIDRYAGHRRDRVSELGDWSGADAPTGADTPPGLAALRRLAADVGYRMLGSRSEADDVAQETLVRVLVPLERGDIDNAEAFTTTVATRIALDELKSARRRREQYLGPWLPEPSVEWTPDPVETADDVSYALLVVLETLSPLERAAYLLRDVFDFEYAAIAETLDRTPQATRQLVSRARRHIRAHRPALQRRTAGHEALLDRFLAAARRGDTEGLLALLADDVRLVSDGGRERRAARRPIVGRARVARFVAAVFPKLLADGTVWRISANGQRAYALEDADSITVMVGLLDAHGERITHIAWVLSPSKIAQARRDRLTGRPVPSDH